MKFPPMCIEALPESFVLMIGIGPEDEDGQHSDSAETLYGGIAAVEHDGYLYAAALDASEDFAKVRRFRLDDGQDAGRASVVEVESGDEEVGEDETEEADEDGAGTMFVVPKR